MTPTPRQLGQTSKSWDQTLEYYKASFINLGENKNMGQMIISSTKDT